MYAKDWTIRDNVFVGIRGRTGEARGAIFLWQGSTGCVVERNVIVDCDSGICLGNSHRGEEEQTHCSRFTVRNNFVTRAPENGILAAYTRDCLIAHNTVCDPQSRQGRLIRVVHDNDGLRVVNNLLCGPVLRNESESRMEIRNNLAQDLSSTLADPKSGNLRLTSRSTKMLDRAVPLSEVRDDIDGTRRGEKPDLGAHELTR
jgi:hypothetical protein